jgi:hypothetical protein
MKIFQRPENINFVDQNNVVLGYSLESTCCEDPYWFISNTIHREFNKNKTIQNIQLLNQELLDFLFDQTFFELYIGPFNVDTDTCLNLGIFRLISPTFQIKYLHIANIHNGCYQLGFKFTINDQILQEGYL